MLEGAIKDKIMAMALAVIGQYSRGAGRSAYCFPNPGKPSSMSEKCYSVMCSPCRIYITYVWALWFLLRSLCFYKHFPFVLLIIYIFAIIRIHVFTNQFCVVFAYTNKYSWSVKRGWQKKAILESLSPKAKVIFNIERVLYSFKIVYLSHVIPRKYDTSRWYTKTFTI